MHPAIGHHDDDYKYLLTSATLARTIDGLLISLESFIYVLEEDSTKMNYDVNYELKYYLARKESDLILGGIKSCWNSFEYLVMETPRFKLIRKYYDIIKNIINEKGDIHSEKTYECISPPALWRKEYEEAREAEADIIKPVPIKVKKIRRYSWVEVVILIALALSITSMILRFFVSRVP
jgi:hypothetical protein